MRELDEIKAEHRAILNLFLSVIILGLLLNCWVSALFVAWQHVLEPNIWPLLGLLSLLTGIFTWMTIRVAILRPMRIGDEFSTLLVFDTVDHEVSIPLVMSVSRERPVEAPGAPFPILARGVHRRLKNSELYPTTKEDDESSRPILVEQLVQFVILQWYRWHHMDRWVIGRDYRRVGPIMGFGWFPEKPSNAIPISELAEKWREINPFVALQYSDKTETLVLPKGIELTLEGPADKDGRHKIVLAGKTLDLSIWVGCAGGSGGAWNMRTWNRQLTSQPENSFAYSITVEYEIVIHEGIHRYIPQGLWDWPFGGLGEARSANSRPLLLGNTNR